MTTRQLFFRFQSLMDRPYFQYLLLAGITLVALVFRFYKLGEWSFWIDEIRTINRATAHYTTLSSMLQNIPPSTNWVPISTILTAGASNLFGLSEWSARIAPAVIGVISIPILFFQTRRLFGSTTSLIVALLLALSSWHISWSQNARFLTALMLFYALAFFAFFLALERNRLTYIGLFIIFLYLAASERLYALFIVPVILAYLLMLKVLKFEKPPGANIKNLSLLFVPGIVFVLIEALSFVFKDTSRFFADFNVFLGNSIENPLGQAVFIFSDIGIPIVMFSFFTGIYLILQKDRLGLFLWLGAVIPVASVILVTPFTFTEERYAFVSLPFWLMLAAIGVRELYIKSENYAKLLAIGILLVFFADFAGENLMYYRVNNGNRRDWKGAFALVEERMGDEDLIVSTWPELGEYYLNQDVISWQDTNTADIVQRNQRVWFVVIPDMAWFWGSEDFYWWVANRNELIKVQYLRRRDDANLFIYLHEPTQIEIVR